MSEPLTQPPPARHRDVRRRSFTNRYWPNGNRRMTAEEAAEYMRTNWYLHRIRWEFPVHAAPMMVVVARPQGRSCHFCSACGGAIPSGTMHWCEVNSSPAYRLHLGCGEDA